MIYVSNLDQSNLATTVGAFKNINQAGIDAYFRPWIFRDIISYLILRAEDDTSVSGQASRELELIRKGDFKKKEKVIGLFLKEKFI